jgi:hypothetical protein
MMPGSGLGAARRDFIGLIGAAALIFSANGISGKTPASASQCRRGRAGPRISVIGTSRRFVAPCDLSLPRQGATSRTPHRTSSRSDRTMIERLRRQLFTIVMFTPLISPLELISTVCRLPLVCKIRLAANPAAWTNTSILPPPAVPCRLPFTLRLASLQ